MSSILSGFEYDIFISYRHNDNRSGWELVLSVKPKPFLSGIGWGLR
ncbi:MAG TPA: hypothetical protein PKJ83_12365 [Cyclobacteriaceae bacterium]|nr:hypothetical protein [Cyclobacteriaceae bacterium]HPW62354.1 hypothetical protein [Cyclobacteriaceae bacterium]